ncbi:type VI immunity family protein [Serratia fonticola]|uniref:type VI immunity family protein n=1 Tax=Serratia fonticola TaxID=47917 RepID=UPI0009D7899A|nr:type VI immunity family protein [Serratia fonticola]
MQHTEYTALLEQRVPEFTFTDNNDVVISRLGLSITLFFKQGYTLEKREKILACFSRFRDEFSTHLRFHAHEFEGMKKYTPENIAKVEDSIRNKDIDDYGGWDISDAKNMSEAPNCLMSYLDSGDDDDNENSYLSLVLPWFYLKETQGMARFNDWLTYLCQQLEPDSGDCGYCLILPRDYHDYFSIEYELAKRYPPMQVNSAVHTASRQYTNSIRGVNWITVLDKRYIKRLGGEDWVRQVLSRDPAISIEPYPGGLLIRAGQYPDLTPVVAGLSPHYLAVNQLIRPIRVKHQEGHSLHFYGVNHFDELSTQAWYARYDQGPLSLSPLESGTPALVSGNWTTPSFPHTMRVIHQGEMAPMGKEGEVIWWDLASEVEDDGNGQAPRS